MKMLSFKILALLIGLLSCQGQSQATKTNPIVDKMDKSKRLEVNGMTVEWQYRKDRAFFTLSAPTEGWVTLGFNEKDDIKGTNLIFCRVKSGKIELADHYVVAAGNHQPTEKIGGKSVFADISGVEKAGQTTVSFSMPAKAADAFHFDLTEGTQRWFICAFSSEDDFYHHSRMREHRQVTL